MAKNSHFLLLLTVLYITSTAKSATTKPSSSLDTNYVKASCKSTTYPPLCVQTLSGYATQIARSPRRMSLVALSVSQSRTLSAYTLLTKLNRSKNLKKMEYRAIADCLELMDDSVDRLRNSVQELKNLGQVKTQNFLFHMSNVQTWASASLTNGNTCLDEFADKALNGKVKDSVRAQVLNVVQVTSNALALINQFAKRH